MLARLWKRDVETVAQTSPPAPPRQLLKTATLESPEAPGRDSLKAATRRKRKALNAPLARIWLLDRETPPSARPTARDHAARLPRWVRENGHGGKLVLAMDLQKIYPVMCEQLGWQPHRWQPIACAFRKLTGNVKPYRWVEGHRRRAYPV